MFRSHILAIIILFFFFFALFHHFSLTFLDSPFSFKQDCMEWPYQLMANSLSNTLLLDETF